MKVLQVVGLAGPDAAAGGVWQVVRNQCSALSARGHDVTAVAGWLGKVPTGSDADDTVRLIRVRRLYPWAGLRGLWSVELQRVLDHQSKDVDVAHVHLCRDYVTTTAVMYLKRRGIPVVAQTHGMVAPGNSRLIRVFDSLVFKRALEVPTEFLSLTSRETSDLAAMGVPEDIISKVVNAAPQVEVARSRPTCAVEERPFVFAARMHRRKQPLVFVEAALRLLESGYRGRFIMVGPDQGEMTLVEQCINGSKYGNHFVLTGALRHEDTLDILSTARALVLPSRNEPFPMVVLEAASVACPIVLTNESEISEGLRRAGAAIAVDPTVDGIYAAMSQVIALGESVCDLGARAQRYQQQYWNLETLGGALEAEYVNACLDS